MLTTKVQIPPQPHHAVQRKRLVETLEGGIPHHKLIQVSAPAGYGKTTLLTQWAHSSRLTTAWLSLDQEDNEPERFLRYLLIAWEQIQPGIMESRLGLLLGGMSPNREEVLSTFINVANDVPDHIVFVLDDFHLIEETTIHDALTFMLDHLPPTLHFVLAGRADAPLPLARYRARQELLELRASHLQFVQDETADFLNRRMGLELSPDEVVKLQTQLEGWIAGLQLVALTLQKRFTGGEKLVISGKHRFVADYLSEDVLNPQTGSTRQFLFQTSLLDSLCSSLCDAVTGRNDSQEMLETLERENLFLVPLDDRREWFRYNRLFADFLKESLYQRHPEQVTTLHRRAAHWYLSHDFPDSAFRHAIAGSDAEVVVQIFDRYCNAKLNGGEIRVVERWVASIPQAWYETYPVLGLARVGLLAFTGAFEACTRYLDEVEQRLIRVEREDRDWQQARVISVRCMMACMQNDVMRAGLYANQALQTLPEENLGWRPGIYTALGDTYRRIGRWDDARGCYLKALSVTDSPQIRFMSVHVFGALADLALRQGHHRDAYNYWQKARAVIQERETWGHLELPVTGWVNIRMAELHYERNELTKAWDHLSRGLEQAELGGDVRALIAGYLIAGRVKLTRGDVEAAADDLERARPLVENAEFDHWTSRFQRFQLEVWLAQDRLRAAVEWSDTMLRDTSFEDWTESEVAQLAIARVLIIKGDTPSITRALAIVDRLLQIAQAEGRVGISIEALLLQALARWQRGEQVDAMTALEQALRLAEPENYIRLFADYGPPAARLLQEANSRSVLPDYVERLLVVFEDDHLTATHVPLPEPLTQREQEVLELVAAGLTNEEIAEKLVISPETVKKHAGNIYGKLSVSNRTEAAARARELDLLE